MFVVQLLQVVAMFLMLISSYVCGSTVAGGGNVLDAD